MADILPFEDVKRFFDILRRGANKDGYYIGTVSGAGVEAKLHIATAYSLPDRLAEMGVIEVFRAKRGKGKHTLIKVTGNLTPKVYDDYWFDVVTVVRKRRH